MVRIEVHNFQSIQEGVVDIDGFSVVVGRSNIGKSALVRAIKAALTGAPADNYVRHGANCQRVVKGAKSCKCFCSVHIQAPDLDLLWEKGDSVNRYVHNGIEHTVVGKGTPEFLGPGFAPIYIGGDTTPTLLQVADQFRPLFILDRSGTAVADVLSDVAKLDQINDASRSVERDRRECSSTRKVRDKDLKELDLTIALYDDLDATLVRVAALEQLGQKVAAVEAKLEITERLTNVWESLSNAIFALEPVEKVSISAPTTLYERADKLGSLTLWREALQLKITSAASLKKWVEVVIPDIYSVVTSASNHMKLVRWTSQLIGIKATFAKFKGVESSTIPEITDLTAKHFSYRTILEWAEKMSRAESAVIRLQKAKAAAESEEATILSEFKALEVCPTCRQPIKISAHLHEVQVHA